jgi:GntR family transcriptional regulator
MHIQLDFRSGQPIYVQIVEQIRQMVGRGELQPGDQLPTVRQLATDLRVNFNTVARAYRLLDEAGLISTQHGRGTYVWEAPSDEVMERLRWQGLEDLMEHCIQEARRLGYSMPEIRQAFEAQALTMKESIHHEEDTD